MHILVGGGTGFIGKHLCKRLVERGHRVTVISRFKLPELRPAILKRKTKPSYEYNTISWQQFHWGDGPDDVHALVNLSGNRFWQWDSILDPQIMIKGCDSAIEKMETSRQTLATICSQYCIDKEKEGKPLKVYVQGSSYWYYHVNEDTQDRVWTEEDEGGWHGLISNMTRHWETAARLPEDSSTRSVILRTGNVLSPEDGLLRNYYIRSKLFLGGPLRPGGANPLNWIHIEDMIGIIEHAIDNCEVSGVLNCVAPELSTHMDLATHVAARTRRPNWYSPSNTFVHRIYGPDTAKLLTESAWVSPERTMDSGYGYKFINLDNAIEHLLQKQNIPRGLVIRTLYTHWCRLLGGTENIAIERSKITYHMFMVCIAALIYTIYTAA